MSATEPTPTTAESTTAGAESAPEGKPVEPASASSGWKMIIGGALVLIASPLVYMYFHHIDVHGGIVRGPWFLVLIYAFLGAVGLTVVAVLFGAFLVAAGWTEVHQARTQAAAAALDAETADAVAAPATPAVDQDAAAPVAAPQA